MERAKINVQWYINRQRILLNIIIQSIVKHTHARTHARTHTYTHTYTHTRPRKILKKRLYWFEKVTFENQFYGKDRRDVIANEREFKICAAENLKKERPRRDVDPYKDLYKYRTQELCESRGGGLGLPTLISLRFLWT